MKINNNNNLYIILIKNEKEKVKTYIFNNIIY